MADSVERIAIRAALDFYCGDIDELENVLKHWPQGMGWLQSCGVPVFHILEDCQGEHWPKDRADRLILALLAGTEHFPSVVSGSLDKKTKKPPLGVIPEKMWVENRLHDVHAAILRYVEADIEYPPEWDREILTRMQQLRHME